MNRAPGAAAPPLTWRSRSADDTGRLGARFAPALAVGDLIALSGPLGAGKTRFVAGLAAALSPGAHVRSPSFTLVNEYDGRVRLLHLDLYRVDSREVDGLGLDELLERGAVIVEWGDKLPARWTREALRIEIEPGAGDERELRLSAAGDRGLTLLEAARAAVDPA